MTGKIYQPLATTILNYGASFLQPIPYTPDVAHLDDPALDAMLDFSRTQPITISLESPILEARANMKSCGIHLILVTNQENQVIGAVTMEDILGEKPIKLAQQRKIPRHEIKVRGVMTPSDKLLCVDIESLRHAKIGNIVQTLRHYHQHHCLVLGTNESTAHTQIIVGLFSAYQLSDQLGINVFEDDLTPQSLVEIQQGDFFSSRS